MLKTFSKGAAIASAVLMIPAAVADRPVAGGLGLQPQVTNTGRYAEWMHNTVLMYTITAISLFVLGLLVWVALRYRAKANPVPSKTSHNTTIEVVWTLVPALILAAIAFPSFKLLAEQTTPAPKNAITLKAVGHQWYWSYSYPDLGEFEIVANMLPDAEAIKRGEPRLLATDNRIVLPVGVPIRLQTTSEDVIHAWFIPAFWTQVDAVPGRINEASFTIEKPGVYYGQCNQICGARHGYMPITVEAVSKPQFDAWIASKKAPAPAAAAPGAAPAVPPAATPASGPATPATPAAATTAPATAS